MRSAAARIAAALLVVAALCTEASSQTEAADPPVPRRGFEDIAERVGVDFTQRSGGETQSYIADVKACGVAVLDWNGDAFPDLLFTQGSSVERARAGKPGYGARLFARGPDGQYVDRTGESGLPELGWSTGCAAADIDDDGDDDLLVTGIGGDRLFRNDASTFVEITQTSELPSAGWSSGAAFGDLDGDGDLDLYIARYLDFDVEDPPVHGDGLSCLWKGRTVLCGPRGLPALSDCILENVGDGQFLDRSNSWGIDAASAEFGLGVVIVDLDDDGANEIFVANDSSPNHLWDRQGERFVESAFAAGVSVDSNGDEQAGMGIDVVDIDGDLDLDLFVTNFENERNNLYVRQAGFYFDDAQRYGLGFTSQSALSWGAVFRDFDADGALDLYVANGHVYPQADEVDGSLGYAQRDDFYVGKPAGSGPPFSLDRDAVRAAPAVGRAVAVADLDGDLDDDIIVANLNARPHLFENNSRGDAGGRLLRIELRQPAPNVQALGALVDVEIGEVRRRIAAIRHASFQSTHEAAWTVGLGAERSAGRITVRWPDGTRERFEVPGATESRSERLRLVRGEGQPVDAGDDGASSVPSPAPGSSSRERTSGPSSREGTSGSGSREGTSGSESRPSGESN